MQDMNIHTRIKHTARDKDGREYPTKTNTTTGEIEVKSPYFFQFYKDNFPAVQTLIDDNHLASRIFFFLVENMDYTNAVIVSYQVLEEIYGISRQTISKAIKYLKSNKYIDIKKSGNINVYCVNASLVWTKDHNQIKYAKFYAKVIISEREQGTKKTFQAEVKVKNNNKNK